ncbi:MAG: hypothetical protein OEY56_06080 [Cyclobacteriaceae bacterium]|nr:hypothetical protein [Cyclobacteriaceae bacterium]
MPKYFLFFLMVSYHGSHSQSNVIELGETKEAYIEENHIEDIESVVHSFTSSSLFLKYLIEQGHNISYETIEIKRKDVSVGKDIDIYVKHFTEHQTFTMLLVPIDIYPLAIYDTLLFAVIEVSDQYLMDKYYRNDLENDSVKKSLLALENHDLLVKHMYEQAMKGNTEKITEIQVQFHESYISSSSIQHHIEHFNEQEKHDFRRNWGIIKKAFTHNVELNVEMNIYIFGHDDMEVVYYHRDKKNVHRITPSNIFTRHHFVE